MTLEVYASPQNNDRVALAFFEGENCIGHGSCRVESWPTLRAMFEQTDTKLTDSVPMLPEESDSDCYEGSLVA